MRVQEIILVPGAGNLGNGTYSRGHAVGVYAEVDLVDKYVRGLADELDNARVRHRIFDTRKAPGLTPSQHMANVYPGNLVIHCGCGWNDAKKVKALHNISAVTHTPAAAVIARDMASVMGHWGSLYVFGHRTAQAVVDDHEFFPKDGLGIHLEPIKINGPKMEEYGKWLDNLGRDLGRYLADFLMGRGDGAVGKVTTIRDYLMMPGANVK